MDQTLQESLLACLNTAKVAGSPSDQANNFLSRGYTPHVWQWKFHAAARAADLSDGPVEIGCGGARGPGKSHAIFAQAALDDAQRVEKLKILFIRKTAISAKESFGDLIERIIQGKVPYTISNNVITFQNESRILLGGFHSEDDIDKYVGVEYDIIVIEELNQLTEEKLEKLKGSLRTSKPNWRPRLYASFNPGGIGHGLVKGRFVLPHRLMEETKTRFIPATYLDNTSLNKEYIEYLEGLQGDLGRAWREGDFDLFAGQFFREWRQDIHVCDPFEIPEDWAKFFAFDYGFNHPLSLGWYAVSPDGNVYKYRELWGSGMSYTQAAEEFVAMTQPKEKLDYGSCDPALWAKKGERDDILSGAEVFAKRVGDLTGKQPRLVKADNARVTGWGVVREYLRPFMGPDEKLTARLQIFSTCKETIRTAPEQVHDDRVPEDMAKQDGDDCWDECVIAGTLVETISGSKVIEKICVGEKVLTQDGYKEVTAVFSNGVKPVFKVAGLIATANHPLWVEGVGFTPVADIRYGDMIRSCTQTNIEKLRGSCGLRILERFQKIMKYITKIITQRIIIFRILNAYQFKIITRSITMKCQSLLNNALFVVLNIKQKLLGKDSFARTNANLNLVEINRLTTLPSFVQNVENHSQRIDIVELDSAQKAVMQDSIKEKPEKKNVISVKESFSQKTIGQFGVVTVVEKPIYVGKRKVYNLSVADNEEYFANGLLVHNCRYALMSRPRPAYTPAEREKSIFDKAMKKKNIHKLGISRLRFVK